MRPINIFRGLRRHTRRSRSLRLGRPVEVLEDRTLLSCDIRLLDDGTLHVQGDEGDNHLSIVDGGGGNVAVECHDAGRLSGETLLFEDVRGILAEMLDGDDAVTVRAGLRSDGELVQAVAEQVYLLGAGNDTLSLRLGSLIVDPAGNRFEVEGGAGIDDIRVEAADVLVEGALSITAFPDTSEAMSSKPKEIVVVGSKVKDVVKSERPGLFVLGNDDPEQVELQMSPGPFNRAEGAAHGHLDFLKVAGDPATSIAVEEITISYEDIDWTLDEETAVNVDIQTDGGDDTVSAVWLTTGLFEVVTGDGNDTVGILLRRLANPHIPTEVNTGGVDDVALGADRIVPPSTVEVNTGGGNDQVFVEVENLPSDITISLGDGDNTAAIGTLRTVSAAQTDYVFYAGEGADSLTVDMSASDRDAGLSLEAVSFEEVHLAYETFDPSRTVKPVQLDLDAVAFGESAGTSVMLAAGDEGLQVQAENFNDTRLALETIDPSPIVPETPTMLSLSTVVLTPAVGSRGPGEFVIPGLVKLNVDPTASQAELLIEAAGPSDVEVTGQCGTAAGSEEEATLASSLRAEDAGAGTSSGAQTTIKVFICPDDPTAARLDVDTVIDTAAEYELEAANFNEFTLALEDEKCQVCPEKIKVNGIDHNDSAGASVFVDHGADGSRVEAANFNEITLEVERSGADNESPEKIKIGNLNKSESADTSVVLDFDEAGVQVEAVASGAGGDDDGADYAIDVEYVGLGNLEMALIGPDQEMEVSLAHAIAPGDGLPDDPDREDDPNLSVTNRLSSVLSRQGPDSLAILEVDTTAAIAIPSLLRSRMSANEAAAASASFTGSLGEGDSAEVQIDSYDLVSLEAVADARAETFSLHFLDDAGAPLASLGVQATEFEGSVNIAGNFHDTAGGTNAGFTVESVLTVAKDGQTYLLDAAGLRRFERRLTGWIDGEYRETIVGTTDDDTVVLHTDNVEIGPDGSFDSQVRLLDGDDAFEVQMENIIVAGTYSQVVHGDEGSDWLRVAQPHAAGPVAILSGAAWTTQLLGGDGDDLIESRSRFELGVTSMLGMATSGGAGNDRLIIEDKLSVPADSAPLDPANPPAISYLLDGGAGDDELALLVELADELDEFFAAVVDGGEGFDVCRIAPGLPNVLVLNCEDDDASR